MRRSTYWPLVQFQRVENGYVVSDRSQEWVFVDADVDKALAKVRELADAPRALEDPPGLVGAGRSSL